MESLIRTQVQESIASQFKDKRLIDIESHRQLLSAYKDGRSSLAIL
jgi:hypothetical protein